MDIMREYQSGIMLVLIGICGVLALLVYLTKTITKDRKIALMMLEISAMFLLIADRQAITYRGDTTELGWWMVRISNFLVFFLTLSVIYSFNLYLIDLYTHEGGFKTAPGLLKISGILGLVGMAMVVISQISGLYYTFDEMNRYQRAPGFFLSYVFPFLCLILQMIFIAKHLNRLRKSISIPLLVFTAFCIGSSILQLFVYGISLNNISVVIMAEMLYIFSLKDMNREVEHARNLEIEVYIKGQEREHELFEQTAEALAAAIDKKDKYTHGHSARVAMYSNQIAREAGKSAEECEKVYFAALLHDVGKIGVPDAIINKEGKLTDEEFAQITLHPVYGNQILTSIQQSPYLSIGAHYHHERYDGRGYPEGLKGNDIPEIARIISVADAYDAMASKRSYRDAIPQQKVREELVKGMGTQFDPEFAKIMVHLLDLDLEYTMREQEAGRDESGSNRIHCETIYHDCSLGILVTSKMTRVRLFSKPDEGYPLESSLPTLVLFDSLDARIHEDAAKKKDLLYLEYAQIRVDGRTICESARKIETNVRPADTKTAASSGMKYINYTIEAVKVKDHALIRISDGHTITECIVALPDSSRFLYISLTGEHCLISNIRQDQDEEEVGVDYIPRIAEEISYIRGCPQGDIPNIQIDGWRSDITKGIRVTDNIKISFHTQSLPTARLVWHCPFVALYTSKNGEPDGEGFREFLLLRLDGENWESDSHAENNVFINHTGSFSGWNDWKDRNKRGMDCEIVIHRDGNQITIETENLGIALRSLTTIKDEVDDIYVALTGDQCALTNIRVISPEQ